MTNFITIKIPVADLKTQFGDDIILTLAKDNRYAETIDNPDYVPEVRTPNPDYVEAVYQTDENGSVVLNNGIPVVETPAVGEPELITPAVGEPKLPNPVTPEEHLARVGTPIMLNALTERAKTRLVNQASNMATKALNDAITATTNNIEVVVE